MTASATHYAAPPTPQALAARLGMSVERICKLDANESPYGPPPKALAALAQLSRSPQTLLSAGRYPDPAASGLCAALAAYTGVPTGQIITGNGSDELIYLLTDLFVQPGDEVVVSEPTFSVYALAARRRGATVVDSGRADDFTFTPEQIAAAIGPRTRLIYLCAPNNPTGTALARDILDAALARAAEVSDGRGGPLVVMDEAYYEIGALAGDDAVWSAASLIAPERPLVVLRTFSKVFGLAGLRVGYALCPPALAMQLRQRKQPYNVNIAAQLAARAALDDLDWLRERATAIVSEREQLACALAALPGLCVYPSAANFLLVEIEGKLSVASPSPVSRTPVRRERELGDEASPSRDAIWEALLNRGIMTRRLGGERLACCLRITIGTPDENTRFLAALRGLLDAKS